ncbi:PH domain-containing protein [Microbacterium sp. NPDC077663]|uniref:PH domain-containing protein n=1 Tax=Microbacterium sp. NPDC077663 TaxID=3364189 RepID=UPI0037C58481
MSQSTAYPGRPRTPAPGAAAPELVIARFRRHGRRLVWSAIVLIAVAGATGYLSGNLVSPWEDWMLWVAAAALILLLVVMPYLRWLSHTYTVTTRRVIERAGLLQRRRVDIPHARGYTISERRGPIQRIWGSGTLTLANGVDEPVRLIDVPSVRLVHETLSDQVEVSQILAHRDSHSVPVIASDD